MKRVGIAGIGLCGPGLPGWEESRRILAGEIPYLVGPTAIPLPLLLPSTERRRTVRTVRLALAVGSEALANAGVDPANIPAVFTSSGGDGETVHSILEVLASAAREVSPTRFHNSVHNAPSGYWSIATGSQAPTTSLCAYDASFVIGLLDATAQVLAEQRPVLLVAYDLPYPAPLAAVRPLGPAFGIALLLTPATAGIPALQLDLATADAPDSTIDLADLEALRRTVPAARSLPLLIALARQAAGDMVMAGPAGTCLRLSL